jgi:hypothetical protein
MRYSFDYVVPARKRQIAEGERIDRDQPAQRAGWRFTPEA